MIYINNYDVVTAYVEKYKISVPTREQVEKFGYDVSRMKEYSESIPLSLTLAC